MWNYKILSQTTEKFYHIIINVNLKGAMFLIKEVVNKMKIQSKGRKIINTVSVAELSEEAIPVMYNYVASRSGLIILTNFFIKRFKTTRDKYKLCYSRGDYNSKSNKYPCN
ncbi:MAG: SDR family oxidoreductase [Firmicutes bacterium]|nr:SDR family oxidoreductase [Bacillota bacterium]